MSRNRFRVDRGYVNERSLKKGPNGRALCRWCQKEVGPNRRTFCSAPCVFEWRIRTDAGYLRQQLHARDRGVCGQCGIDTDKLSSVLLAIYRVDPKAAHNNAWIAGFGNAFKNPSKRWGRPKPRTLWEADHKVGVFEGGGEVGIDGFETLCIPCHRRKTREQQPAIVLMRAMINMGKAFQQVLL